MAISRTIFKAEVIAQRHPAKAGARGRPLEFSDIAIEITLLIRQVFLCLHAKLRTMSSLARAINVDICIPDFISISKRNLQIGRSRLQHSYYFLKL